MNARRAVDPDAPQISRRRFLAASVSAPILAAGIGREAAATAVTIPLKTVDPGLRLAPTVPLQPVTGKSSANRAAAATTPTDRPAVVAADFLQHGPRTSARVALTFHGAGDPALARSVLAITKHAGVPVTVFAVGNWVDAHPDVAKAFLKAGHELGNHTFSHPALRRLSRAAVANEIDGGAKALSRATGGIGAWFRPSGTPTPTTVMLEEAAKVGYKTVVGYDVDPRDYQDPGAKLVVSRTLAAVKGGSIVSLHLGHQGTADALEAMIAGIRSAGFRPDTVTNVLRG